MLTKVAISSSVFICIVSIFRNMNENLTSIGVTIGGGFFAGILIEYALKKEVKVVAIVVGLFFAGLAYLQYQQIVGINWNKLQQVFQNAVATLENATTQIPGFNSGHPAARIIN